jgi:short-subunit dehydrogenase
MLEGALQGISEVMHEEIAPFGVHVTTLCPGSFRTDWAERYVIRTERTIADYVGLFLTSSGMACQAASGKHLVIRKNWQLQS